MKKFIVPILLAFMFVTLPGCKSYNTDAPHRSIEQPHLYWKDIDVTVTSIDRQHWFATTHWYVVSLTVQSEEYGLTKTFQFSGSGAFGCPSQWEYSVGDTVKAELYSWVLDSTGEIVRREIAKVY